MNHLSPVRRILFLWVMITLILSACGPRNGPVTNSTPSGSANLDGGTPASEGAKDAPTAEPSHVAPGVVKVLESQKSRVENPQVDPSDVSQVTNGNTAFAVDLYQKLREQGGNLFFSPYSISVALAMTYAGARGGTEQQMANTMHFAPTGDKLHAVYNFLDQKLASRAKQQTGDGGQAFQLDIANSIWGQDGFSFLPSFLDILSQNYGAGMRVTDFVQSPEASRQAINDWVSQQTQDKIHDLFPEGSIDNNTRLVLANAIYFKASWATPFTSSATQNKPFYLLDKNLVDVPMMTAPVDNQMLYYKGDGVQSVVLPYEGNQVSMVIVMPDEGQYDKFETGLTSGELNQIFQSAQNKSIQLSMPKFKIESQFGLAETLSAMGMKDAFDPSQADFSGMDGNKDLYITSVMHKAFINVDEQGTEAAAATGVAVGLLSMPQEPMRFTVNRPYLFFIRDNETGTILFAGRVLNPAQ